VKWGAAIEYPVPKKGDAVVLSMLMKDKVALVKVDGRRFENLSAMVQPDLVLLADVNLPVEEGDSVERVSVA
jgi:hypothetical protein